MRPPLKILLISDLHYTLKQYDWAAAVAHDFDLVVIAGDHLDVAGQLAGNVQVVVILKYLKRLATRTRVIVSSGNHDLDGRDGAGEKVASWMQRVRELGIPADGDAVEMGDTLISVCPWWDGPTSRQDVERQLSCDAARAKKKWIWVYHAPPSDSPTSWNGRRSFGDEALSGWIARHAPDIVFTGHIHEAPFKAGGSWADRIGSTWVFNSGRQIGPTPTHVVVDTEAREAAWFSMAGAELVRFDAPLQRPFAPIDTPPSWLNSRAPDRSPA